MWSTFSWHSSFAELVDHVLRTHGLTVAPSTIWLLLDRHDMTFKKTAHAAEQQRPDIRRRRQAWFDAQIDLEPERLLFIDGEARSAIGPSGAPNRRIDQDGQAFGTGIAR